MRSASWRTHCTVSGLALILASAGVPAGSLADEGGEPPTRPVESCVGCHSDPDLLVTHPKLYEYYRDWERSIHGQEEVTCSDCHGGDPEASEARLAHAEFEGTNESSSSVGFSRVHETCGDCHDEILEAYRGSKHFAKLREKEGTRHGPTCVTCHNAMNTLTLDVTRVEAACARCHDEETGIAPEVPAAARSTLNKFLSIDRFHRYVSARMDPAESGPFLRQIDERIAALSVLWHGFDLERIDNETQAVLEVMRRKRDEIRKKKAHPRE
jgi:hypothetical protein